MAETHTFADFKVVVVEDSEDLLVVWRALFRKAKIAARFCSTAKAALSVVEHDFLPDLIMTDFYLPDMTGLELIDVVRSRWTTIDCMLVTGNTDEPFIQAVRAAGVPLVSKPVRFPALLETLSEIAARRAALPLEGRAMIDGVRQPTVRV